MAFGCGNEMTASDEATLYRDIKMKLQSQSQNLVTRQRIQLLP
jgi:hypothetical protein